MKNLVDKLKNTGRAIVASALLAGTSYGLTPANQELRDFPMNNIPGIAKIEKYEVEGAKQTLVHLRQKHYTRLMLPIRDKVDAIGGDFAERKIAEVKDYFENTGRCQRDIANAIYALDKGRDIKGVYVEGIFIEDGNLATGHAKESSFCFLDQIRADKWGDCLPTNELECFIPGGANVMASFGLINILGVEDETLNKKGMSLAKYGLYNKEELEDRENYALKVISNSGESFNYLVFGAGHDFRNNLHEWNEKNPEHKYSLIVLSPENLKEEEIKW